MNKAKFILGAASVVLAMAFIFSCSSDDDGGGTQQGGTTYSYCIYSDARICSSGSFTECQNGGIPSNDCPFTSGNIPSSSSVTSQISGFCDYGPIQANGDGGCFPMSTEDDLANCAAWGNVVSSCPTSVPSSSSINRPSSSSVPPPVPSSSSINTPSSSSVVQTLGYCDYGPVQANGDGGCHPMGTNSDLASCQQWGHVVSSCPTANYGLVEHGGQRYRTVVIGNQTWMAQNLNYEYGNSTCYDNKSENCAKYGQLYDWASMTGQESNSVLYTGVPANFRGVCPTGWHIPTDGDWNALITAVGGSSTAGRKLKAKDGWENNGNGTDEYGFRAFPAGYREFGGGNKFGNLGWLTGWWSITQSKAHMAYPLKIYSSDNNVSGLEDFKEAMYSVRCVKN